MKTNRIRIIEKRKKTSKTAGRNAPLLFDLVNRHRRIVAVIGIDEDRRNPLHHQIHIYHQTRTAITVPVFSNFFSKLYANMGIYGFC